MLISRRNRSLPTACARSGPEHLDGDGAAVLHVAREVHGGHAAVAKLTLDGVPAGEGLLEAGPDVAHGQEGTA